MDISHLAGREADGFAAAVEPYRRRLHVHCYRMLASFDEAEDAVQETFLRAWRNWDRFEDGLLDAAGRDPGGRVLEDGAGGRRHLEAQRGG